SASRMLSRLQLQALYRRAALRSCPGLDRLSTALSVTAAPPQHTAAGSATFCNDRAALERVLVLRVRPSAPDGNGHATPRLVERTRNISHAEKAWLGARANRATYRVATRCTRSV